MGNDKFKDITINWDKKKGISVSEDEAAIFCTQNPNAICWIVDSEPPDTKKVKILWDTRGPFNAVKGDVVGEKKKIKGYKNCKDEGKYKYAILFIDKEGKIIDWLDPIIIIRPDN